MKLFGPLAIVLATVTGAHAAPLEALSASEYAEAINGAPEQFFQMVPEQTTINSPNEGLFIFNTGNQDTGLRIDVIDDDGNFFCGPALPCVRLTTTASATGIQIPVLNLENLDRPGGGDDSNPEAVVITFLDPVGAVDLNFRNIDASDFDNMTDDDTTVEVFDTPALLGGTPIGTFELDESSSRYVTPNDVGFRSVVISLSGGGGTNLLSLSVVTLDDFLAANEDVDGPSDPVPVPGALVLFGSVLAGFKLRKRLTD